MKVRRKIVRFLSSLFVVSAVTLYMEPSRGAISMVVCTPASPTILSTGLGYYLAGGVTGSPSYNYTVRVVDPAAASWADITLVRLTIPNSTNIVLRIVDFTPGAVNYDIGGAPGPGTMFLDSGNVNVTASVAGNFNDFTVTFFVTYRWDTPESVWAAARPITAEANSVTSPGIVSAVANTSYGVCSSIRMFNQAQDGEAADGWISPFYTGFNVTSILVYNVPGAGVADNIETRDNGEISGTLLLLDGASTTLTDNTPAALSYAVSNPPVPIPLKATAYDWTIEATMSTPGGPKTTVNALQIRSDEVEVQDISFIGGGGRTTNAVPPKRFYRSVPVPGAQFRVQARMRASLLPMVGNTTVTIETTGGIASGSVVIPNGTNTWDAALTYPLAAAAPVGSTTLILYRASGVSGGATGTQTGSGNILQYAALNYSGIFWDNVDPPGLAGSGNFTNPPPNTLTSQTATSFTLTWKVLDNTCTTAVCPEGDFDTYKLYYKQTAAPTWTVIDKGTNALLANILTSAFDVTGLQPLTNYDYRFSAVDIFGNEVATPPPLGPDDQPFGTISTSATGIEMNISDGITNYQLDSKSGATDLDPVVNYPLRKVNVRVAMKIFTTKNNPENVSLLVADNASDLVAQYGLFPGPGGQATQDNITDASMASARYTYNCLKTGANKWEGYIPDSCPAMVAGNSLRFIVAITLGGATTYEDHEQEPAPPGDHWSKEWRFYVSKNLNLVPWPTKVLNNVLTRNSPICYPAYYLTHDALVTIKVFDIQGRPIATLQDRAFRKAGENIKEGGWYGVNKNGRKVGPGLYYIHIKAEAGSRVLIDKYSKVVVAW